MLRTVKLLVKLAVKLLVKLAVKLLIKLAVKLLIKLAVKLSLPTVPRSKNGKCRPVQLRLLEN